MRISADGARAGARENNLIRDEPPHIHRYC
jgi:hypothetical protein